MPASRAVLAFFAAALPLLAHDPITTKLTWSKEISRLFLKRCMACHQNGGRAPFPLTTYAEARPWAVAIRDEVARRKMPPWNAVKGFGDFANDRALSQEEITLIVDWVNGGAPEGDPKYAVDRLPNAWSPAKLEASAAIATPGAAPLAAPALLTALRVKTMKAGGEARLLLVRADGSIEPLAWIRNYRPAFNEPLIFRSPIRAAPGAHVVPYPARAGAFELLTAPERAAR
jgi:hypothetical protein